MWFDILDILWRKYLILVVIWCLFFYFRLVTCVLNKTIYSPFRLAKKCQKGSFQKQTKKCVLGYYLSCMLRYVSNIKFTYSEKAKKVCKISTVDLTWPLLHRANLRWRFCKNLWPSQNIWTLQICWCNWIEKYVLLKTKYLLLQYPESVMFRDCSDLNFKEYLDVIKEPIAMDVIKEKLDRDNPEMVSF